MNRFLKRKKIILKVFSWLLLYSFWVMVFQRRTFAVTKTATIEFCYLIFVSANYYVTVLYTIPQFFNNKKYVQAITLFISGIVVTALLRVPLASYLNKHYFLPYQIQPGFSELFSNSIINIFIWSILIVSCKLMFDRLRMQEKFELMQKEKERAELDFLNAQLNPHFLFNSLNLIYGSIDKQNNLARNMLLTFSDMLRYQLYDCSNEKVSIEKEMSYITNYVALQKARKSETLEVNLHIDTTVKHFTIHPLLFISFIENAFKYVSSNTDERNFIDIAFSLQDNFLHFNCVNSKEIQTEAGFEYKGIGITNIKRRLSLLYPDNHFLDIEDNGNTYRVTLKLKVN